MVLPASGENKVYGSYKLLERIGEGGMARVFRAEHLADRSIVALKVFSQDDVVSPEFLKRVKREIATLKQCSHPNIVKVHGYSLAGKSCFLALHYIEGQNLEEYTRERGRFPLAEVLRIARDIGGALAYCHARGLFHRDIKPANIMLQAGTGRAILLDFGIVKATNMTDISVMNQVRGTLTYMSPEQFLNRPVDGRTDIYMLGLVLVRAATGEDPFDPNQPFSLDDLTGNRPLPSIRGKVPDFPAEIETLIHNCLHPEPRDRYGSAHEFLAELEKAAAGKAVSDRTQRRRTLKMSAQEFRPVDATLKLDRPSRTVVVPPRRSPVLMLLLGVSPLIVLLIVCLVLYLRSR